MFKNRKNAEYIKKLPAVRRFMPFLLKSRNESLVFSEKSLDLTKTLKYLEKLNKIGKAFNLFHLVLAACVKTFIKRPFLNQFVLGSRLYRNLNVTLSFAVKKEFNDKSPFTMVKQEFSDTDNLSAIFEKVEAAKKSGRGEEKTRTEKEISLLTLIPGFLISIILWLFRKLDSWNLVPHSFIKSDPLYTSAAIANLGSLGLDAAYHHLYEWGTASLFITIGKVEKKVFINSENKTEVRDGVTFKFTMDERICDGYYAAKSLDYFQELIENPELLEK